MAIVLKNILIMELILVSSPLQVFSWLGDQLHSSLRVSGSLAVELFIPIITNVGNNKILFKA